MRQQENTAQLTDNKVTEKKTTKILIEYLLMYMYHCKCISGSRKTIKLK